jgi:phosphinothricin acetyltransferase
MEQRIRRAAACDADAIRAIYAPAVSDSAISFETIVPEPVEIERRIDALGDRHPWLVLERAGAIRGYAYASPHRTRAAYQWCVEVSVYVHADAQRRGVGRALYAALFEVLRRQRFVNAYAGITLPNPSSVGLHQSLGFAPVGVYRQIGFKFGRWHDVLWLERRLRDGPPESDPLPLSAVWDDPGLLAALDAHAETARV